MHKTFRSFIALELPPSVQADLGNIIVTLQQPGRQFVRWVPAHNIHLTLKFLGDLTSEKINQTNELLRLKIAHHPRFLVHLTALGAYPGLDRPRVIWMGLKAPRGLFVLQNCIEDELSSIGIPKEHRPFSPHLTIGRVKNNATVSDIHSISVSLRQMVDLQMPPMSLDTLTLFRSELTPEGAVYEPILRFKLTPA